MLTITAPTAIDTAIETAVARLDAWLDTLRGPDGYGGPVAHWWQQSLLYTGAGRDWRYEGIIDGYLHLWRNTNDERWLHKARRAGDDLIAGQLPNDHFAASGFEINPVTAGTPHEAACDVGLLLLAQALREAGQDSWRQYAACAQRNLQSFYVEQLWDDAAQSFRDSPRVPSFVPNKAATACDALFLLAELTADAVWVERYALPTLNRILDHQVRGGRLDGAIAQNSFGARTIAKYFPIYIARCVPALLHGYRWTNDESYAAAALRTLHFLVRWTSSDGSLPTVVYANGHASGGPDWIAPLGDVLRAAAAARPYGFDQDLRAVEQRLLNGQDGSGGIQTATGFALQTGGRRSGLPDLRDVLHVAGWCDKAFRYLAAQVRSDLPEAITETFAIDCAFRGKRLRFCETADRIEITDVRGVCYRWRKGAAWPEVATEEFWLR